MLDLHTETKAGVLEKAAGVKGSASQRCILSEFRSFQGKKLPKQAQGIKKDASTLGVVQGESLGFLPAVLSKVATLYPQVIIVTIDDNALLKDAKPDGMIGTVNIFEVTREQSMARCAISSGFVIGSARQRIFQR